MINYYIFCMLAMLAAISSTDACAAAPPQALTLTIETGMHRASINRIATDADGRLLVTASDDKTVRVWELPSGHLAHIIRPPIGEGNEGKIHAVALSPDGLTIASGGWTKLGSAVGHTIYLFNRASGAMTGRIPGLPSVINHLTFSPDGRYIAATLGTGGIRIFRTADRAPAGEDKSYQSDSNYAHFSRDGLLVTTGMDGYLRLYQLDPKGLTLIAKKLVLPGGHPYAARFSPDGTRIAVGFAQSSKVWVLSSRDLSLLYSADTKGVAKDDLTSVDWSADGRFLYAAGNYRKKFSGTWKFAVRRWDDGGRGKFTDRAAADDTITDLAHLPKGGLAFSSTEPSFGILDENAQLIYHTPSTLATFRNNREGFLVSTSGDSVQFAYERWGKSPALFNLSTRSLTIGRTAGNSLLPPITSVKNGPVITDWLNSSAPKLDAVTLTLKPGEVSRALAIAPDGKSFILGADWSLRRYDRQGKSVWQTPLNAIAWAVNISGDGKLALAALGDGTIRWFRMSDGKELLALFPHADRKRWVLWNSSGFYDTSPGGEALIGWHLNNGNDQVASFFPTDSLRADYYRPDTIGKIFNTLNEPETELPANDVAALRLPLVEITSHANGAAVTSDAVTIRFTVRTPAADPVVRVHALVDGKATASRVCSEDTSKDGNVQELTFTIPRKDCEVAITAENSFATSAPAKIRLRWSGADL